MKNRVRSLEAKAKPRNGAVSAFIITIAGEEDDQPACQTATCIWPTGEAMRLEGLQGETSADFERRVQTLEGLDFEEASKWQAVPLQDIPHHLIPEEMWPMETVRIGG
ncbi:MAG TPA: hypothetical protein DEO85_14945 [Maritimibacter sp.]|nr:hypothetical protein [Maritimibacter sp.]